MLRLFTAVPLPEGYIERLSLLRRSLPGVRWIDRANLHLTLQFIGEVDNGQYHSIVEALDGASSGGFDLTVRGGGFFGSARKPRVFWAGVQDCPGLLELNRNVRHCLGSLVELESRNYSPHISLARLKQCSRSDLAILLESAHYLEMSDWRVDRFCLYSSRLGPGGSRYSIEAEYPIAP